MKWRWLLGSSIFLVIWYLVTVTGLIKPVFLPSPLAVAGELVSLGTEREFFVDLFDTVWRTLLGFSVGCAVGVFLGLLMGSYRLVYDTIEFPIDFFRSIPATALFPLFIVIWGLGDQVQVFIAAWASSMVVLISTVYGMRNVGPLRLMVAKTKNLPTWRVFFMVKIPDALPFIVAGTRVALSLSLVVEIVAEMFLGTRSGLGRRIFNATSIFEMEEAYAGVFVVGVLGYLLNKCVMCVERRFVHWAGK